LNPRYYTQVRINKAKDRADTTTTHPLKVGDVLNLANTIILGIELLSVAKTKVFIIDEIAPEKANADFKSEEFKLMASGSYVGKIGNSVKLLGGGLSKEHIRLMKDKVVDVSSLGTTIYFRNATQFQNSQQSGWVDYNADHNLQVMDY